MDGSIENIAARRERERQREAAQPQLISLEVRPRPDLEEPFLVGSLKLKGELPVKKDLNAGDLLTVQIADGDGTVIASGIFEVGLPAFKDVKMKDVGIIGTERAHSAKFLPGE